MFGKKAKTLQSNVVVNGNSISGNLKYVTGYTGFSGDPALQSGNYLAIKFSAAAGATTKVTIIGGTGPVTLDSDMNMVIRVSDITKKIKVESTLSGKTITQIYDLLGLVLETA